MEIEFVPTLAIQRELYSKRRNMARFHWYIDQLTGPNERGGLDIALPIGAVNPMGREHCLSAVEALLAIDAESAVEEAIAEIKSQLLGIPGVARVCLNVLDDFRGGWTNRYFSEAGMRLGSEFGLRANRTRHFVVIPAWSSESYTRETIRAETAAAIYRHTVWENLGLARTVGALLRWEGLAIRFTGAPPTDPLLAPCLSGEELDYTREVLAAVVEATDFPTHFATFFGDEPAVASGYPPLGIPTRAGFALALDEARNSNPSLELRREIEMERSPNTIGR